MLVENILFLFGGFQDLFLNDISIINLNYLDYYKSYTAKNLLQITRPPIGEAINFVLTNQKISFNKSFFYKKIQLVNEKFIDPTMIGNKSDNNQVTDNNANSFFNNSEVCFQIIDVAKNIHFSVRSLMLFYEIGFVGKLISYVNVKDLKDLIEIAKFFKQTTIKIKLSNILSEIHNLYSQENNNNIDVNSEIFNIGLYYFKDSRTFFSTNFYSLKNKFCSERDYLQVHSKLLLKFIDSSNCSMDLMQIVRGEMFRYLLKYIYEGSFPEINNGEINIYLELLFYARFFKIKSLFKVLQLYFS